MESGFDGQAAKLAKWEKIERPDIMITTVIFDLDGLLVDTEILSYQIYKEMLLEYGYEFTKEDYAQNYSGKTELSNITHLIETYKFPWTVEEGLKKVLLFENRLFSQGVDLKRGAKIQTQEL